MRREVLRIILIFVLCSLLAFGACLLCACIMDRVEPLASAEEYEREEFREDDLVQLRSDPVRSINTTLPDNGVVGTNLLLNSNFYFPLTRYTDLLTDPAGIYYGNNCTVTYNAPSGDNLSYLEVTTIASWAGLYFFLDGISASSTFSFYLKSDVTVNYGLRGFINGSWQVLSSSYKGASSTYGITTVTFSDIDPSLYSRPYLFIWTRDPGTFDICWSKYEVGASFTGYIPNTQELYLYGYNLGYEEGSEYGYAQGFLEGSQAYALRTVTWNFDDVESQNTLPLGWANLGISSSSELETTYFSLSSYWFEFNGYIILDQGTIFLRDQNDLIVGIYLYISTFADFLSYSEQTSFPSPWLAVAILENSSSFFIYDSSFPSNWNPIQYPRAKEVIISAQLGITEWLDKVSTSADSVGYKRGYEVGYDAGLGVGYNNGYSYAIQINETGNWRSMISSLIGVPVSYIRSFFDFQILGFNMLGLFQTLVTLSLFFFLLRFMMGKVSV